VLDEALSGQFDLLNDQDSVGSPIWYSKLVVTEKKMAVMDC